LYGWHGGWRVRARGVRPGAKSDSFDELQQCLTFVFRLCFLSEVKTAALGFRAHSGWTALVALSVSQGVPSVLARQRVHLVENFTYKFRQPYHTAKRMAPDEGRAFVARVQSEARRLAYRAIRELQDNLQAQGYRLARTGLVLASGRPLPRLPQILASHALIHTADGELFRGAILHASARCGLRSATVREKELLSEASRVLHLKPDALTQRIADLGRELGRPWSQDEKFASLVAWMALASRSSAVTRTDEDAD
jgi:hypothetical protein